MKILKSEEEYKAALDYAAALMDAPPDSPEAEELELLSLLIEKYEDDHYPIDLPDPIEAIKFRMEQAGLTRKDMIPYLGSQSKVSEVLSRRRPLSLSMMRALHEGLGIPAEVLLQEPGSKLSEQRYNIHDYPFTEMFRHSYFSPFQGSLRKARQCSESLLIQLFSVIENTENQLVYCRRTDQAIDENALRAWQARVLHIAHKTRLPSFDSNTIDKEPLWELVRQSYFQYGPRNACELLNRWGIHLIILPHLPKTYLDGASFLSKEGNPIIGLTLRHDRLDNFWFTLFHELGHVKLHLNSPNMAFFDDTEKPSQASESTQEKEADHFAQEMLIPPMIWTQYANKLNYGNNEKLVIELAESLQISPAIIAGRIRWETANYHLYGSLVGQNQVREQLIEYKVNSC